MEWFKRLFEKPPAAAAPPSSPVVTDAVRQRFAPLARPALQLRAARRTEFSRLGGLPAMPASAAWPEWRGKPLAFLAQLDLAELHAALPSFLPAAGRLFFFYDQEQRAIGLDPEDAGGWRVLFLADRSAGGFVRRAPAGLDPASLYKPVPVAPHRIDVLPSLERLSLDNHDWQADDDAYFALRNEAFRGQAHHQVLGFPTPIQDDDMELQCQLCAHGLPVGTPDAYDDPRVPGLRDGAAEWRLLLQLDSDDEAGWMWGDVGTLYFWVREAAARRGDFSQVWMILQCG